MKDLRYIISITTIFLLFSVLSVSGQNKQANTSSARAAYGVTTGNGKIKIQKKKKSRKSKKLKATRERSPAYRKRSAWAS